MSRASPWRATRALTRLLNAKTPSQQATDAGDGGEGLRVGRQAGGAADARAARGAAKLSDTLTSTESAYGRLAAAARAKNAAAYNRARTAIRDAEHASSRARSDSCRPGPTGMATSIPSATSGGTRAS